MGSPYRQCDLDTLHLVETRAGIERAIGEKLAHSKSNVSISRLFRHWLGDEITL